MTTIYIFTFLVIILFCAIYFYFFSQKNNNSNLKKNNNLDDVVSVEKKNNKKKDYKEYENEPDYIKFKNLIDRLQSVRSDERKGYTLVESADEVISNIIEKIKDKKYSKYYSCQNSFHYAGNNCKDLFLQPNGDIECGSCAIGLSGSLNTMENKLRGFKLNQHKLDELLEELYAQYIDKTQHSRIELIKNCEQKMSEIIDEIDEDYSTYLSCSICNGRTNLCLSIKDFKNNKNNCIKCDKCIDNEHYIKLTKPHYIFKNINNDDENENENKNNEK